MDEYVGAGGMQGARDLGTDSPRSACNQYHLIAQCRFFERGRHARQRYRKR
jgi:hypothetical protein